MKLDHTRPYQTCISAEAPVRYEQDGITFDGQGNRIDEVPAEPVKPPPLGLPKLGLPKHFRRN